MLRTEQLRRYRSAKAIIETIDEAGSSPRRGATVDPIRWPTRATRSGSPRQQLSRPAAPSRRREPKTSRSEAADGRSLVSGLRGWASSFVHSARELVRRRAGSVREPATCWEELSQRADLLLVKAGLPQRPDLADRARREPRSDRLAELPVVEQVLIKRDGCGVAHVTRLIEAPTRESVDAAKRLRIALMMSDADGGKKLKEQCVERLVDGGDLVRHQLRKEVSGPLAPVLHRAHNKLVSPTVWPGRRWLAGREKLPRRRSAGALDRRWRWPRSRPTAAMPC